MCVSSRVVCQVVVRDSAHLLTSGPLTSVILLLLLLCPWAPRWTWIDGSLERDRKAWTAATLCIVLCGGPGVWAPRLLRLLRLVHLMEWAAKFLQLLMHNICIFVLPVLTSTHVHICLTDQIDCTILLTVFFFFFNLKKSVNTNIYKFYIYMKNLNR